MIPDRWWIVTVGSTHPLAGELLPDTLIEAGARAVVEEGPGRFVAPFLPPEDPEGALATLREELEGSGGAADLTLEWRWQPHEDWSELWRRGLGVRELTPRITVAPSWEPAEAPEGGILIRIDPGMAFGTAEHPTTRGCLRLLDGTVREGDELADVGAGSAILSVAAALLGARSVHAVEMDPLAIPAAVENVETNGVRERVRVEECFVTDEWFSEEGPFDGIIANIEAGVLVPLLPGLRRAVRPGGWTILSGILWTERQAVLDAARREGMLPDREDREGEWWSALFREAASPAEGGSHP